VTSDSCHLNLCLYIYKQAVLFYRAVFKFTYTPFVVYITFVQNVTHCDKLNLINRKISTCPFR
jgi:hypothetical protein